MSIKDCILSYIKSYFENNEEEKRDSKEYSIKLITDLFTEVEVIAHNPNLHLGDKFELLEYSKWDCLGDTRTKIVLEFKSNLGKIKIRLSKTHGLFNLIYLGISNEIYFKLTNNTFYPEYPDIINYNKALEEVVTYLDNIIPLEV